MTQPHYPNRKNTNPEYKGNESRTKVVEPQSYKIKPPKPELYVRFRPEEKDRIKDLLKPVSEKYPDLYVYLAVELAQNYVYPKDTIELTINISNEEPHKTLFKVAGIYSYFGYPIDSFSDYARETGLPFHVDLIEVPENLKTLEHFVNELSSRLNPNPQLRSRKENELYETVIRPIQDALRIINDARDRYVLERSKPLGRSYKIKDLVDGIDEDPDALYKIIRDYLIAILPLKGPVDLLSESFPHPKGVYYEAGKELRFNENLVREIMSYIFGIQPGTLIEADELIRKITDQKFGLSIPITGPILLESFKEYLTPFTETKTATVRMRLPPCVRYIIENIDRATEDDIKHLASYIKFYAVPKLPGFYEGDKRLLIFQRIVEHTKIRAKNLEYYTTLFEKYYRGADKFPCSGGTRSCPYTEKLGLQGIPACPFISPRNAVEFINVKVEKVVTRNLEETVLYIDGKPKILLDTDPDSSKVRADLKKLLLSFGIDVDKKEVGPIAKSVFSRRIIEPGTPLEVEDVLEDFKEFIKSQVSIGVRAWDDRNAQEPFLDEDGNVWIPYTVVRRFIGEGNEAKRKRKLLEELLGYTPKGYIIAWRIRKGEMPKRAGSKEQTRPWFFGLSKKFFEDYGISLRIRGEKSKMEEEEEPVEV